MAKKQRSEYLQSLLENKKNLEERLSEVAKGTVSSIVSENIEKNIRKILSEGEDDFTEDEVDEPEGLGNDADVTDDDVDMTDEDGVEEVDTEEVEDGTEDGAVGVDSEEDETWNDIEEYKDEDGEYDLTGMGTEDVIKVLQVMSPEDGVRVVKNGNGSVTLSDDSTGKEYILDIEGSFGEGGADEAGVELEIETGVGDDDIEIDTTVGDSEVEDDDMDVDVEIEDETDDDFGGEDDDFEDDDDDFGDEEGDDFEEEGDDFEDDDADDDAEIEIESDESDEEDTLNESDVIKNFQNKTAMTTPENGPAEGDAFDGGLPKGTEKRFEKKKGKGKPFGVNECDDPGCNGKSCKGKGCKGEKCEVSETHHIGGALKNTVGATHTHSERPGRNARKGGKQITSTSDSPYQPSSSVEESIKRKANAIFVENKQLKTLIPKLQKQVMEAIVINKSMGNVMKLVMENSTTINEKKSILERFSKVKTIEESDKLYGTIAEELKRDGKTLNLDNAISAQLSESRMNNVKEETPMYINEGVSNVLDLMKRMGMK